MRAFTILGAVSLVACAAVAREPRPAVSPVPVTAGPALTAQNLAGLKQAAAKVLFWSQSERDANFPHMERTFPSADAQTPSPGASSTRSWRNAGPCP